MLRLAFVVALTFAATSAPAQDAEPPQPTLPPHTPGEICITPQGWCWVTPGTPGGPCGCATTDGFVEGRLG